MNSESLVICMHGFGLCWLHRRLWPCLALGRPHKGLVTCIQGLGPGWACLPPGYVGVLRLGDLHPWPRTRCGYVVAGPWQLRCASSRCYLAAWSVACPRNSVTALASIETMPSAELRGDHPTLILCSPSAQVKAARTQTSHLIRILGAQMFGGDYRGSDDLFDNVCTHVRCQWGACAGATRSWRASGRSGAAPRRKTSAAFFGSNYHSSAVRRPSRHVANVGLYLTMLL
ncbi:hypothetical protein EDB81DRAFT_446547 [Dactylonectria macrodidyma]|uniref:Uncharacterized protein n=1 Tax=Dactylonectria macrodidyma TaxID=307937 RepID=A0A9P9F5A5_9HYPO|nr:hypothetical protein EDB81DRAFT_446547 [Dactylonectria macrodidyma]